MVSDPEQDKEGFCTGLIRASTVSVQKCGGMLLTRSQALFPGHGHCGAAWGEVSASAYTWNVLMWVSRYTEVEEGVTSQEERVTATWLWVYTGKKKRN